MHRSYLNDGVLSAVGNTPLIRLEGLAGNLAINVYAKLESANPGGSIKDRPALHMIRDAMNRRVLKPGGLVIESSSGNMAIGLAQVCRHFDLRLICVVDPKVTPRNLNILKAYGAKIDLVTSPDPDTGEFLQARLHRVQELLRTLPGAYWPNQYSNRANSDAHHVTMAEIADFLGSEIDYLFCATSTCGTLRGCVEYIREHKMRTKVYAVDARGSVIFGEQRGKRLIPGHGAGIRPELFQRCLADRCLLVSDAESVFGCNLLLRQEAILAGGSSGAVISAFERVKNELPENSVSVLILADRGERYLETIYSKHWIQENLGQTLDEIMETGCLARLAR